MAKRVHSSVIKLWCQGYFNSIETVTVRVELTRELYVTNKLFLQVPCSTIATQPWPPEGRENGMLTLPSKYKSIL